MTELEKIKESIEKGELIFLTSFFNLFMLRIAALASPVIVGWLIYSNWNGFNNGLTIFLCILLPISIIWSLYFVLTTGSVLLRGNVLIIKRHYRKTCRVNVDQIQGVSERFIKRALSSSGTRITRINYMGNNGKSTFILIMEGRSFLSVPGPSVTEILALAGRGRVKEV
jgi:hypothetical protein